MRTKIKQLTAPKAQQKKKKKELGETAKQN